MRVVITGYNTCCLNHTGGVQVRIKKIYQLLSRRDDVDIEYFRPMETNFDKVDVLHLFKLEPEYFNLVMKAKSEGIKIVLSSVVPISDAKKLMLYRVINRLPVLTIYKMQQMILNVVDKVIAETYQEAEYIKKYYSINGDKIVVIPNGIDYQPYKGDEIYSTMGKKKDYILQVGLVHENKNQLNVIRALKGTGIDLVIIGGDNNGDMRYINLCKKEAEGDEHIHFLGWVDNDSRLLKSAYSNAKVLAFPSFYETFGLVALEGAAAGCNIAISKTLPILDFNIFDGCWLLDPHDVNDIKKKLLSAFEAPLTEKLKDRVIEFFSWDRIIDAHVQVYNEIYQHK